MIQMNFITYSRLEDADCDGIPANEDCNDGDAGNTASNVGDTDCNGILDTCENASQDGDETGVDCGGSCAAAQPVMTVRKTVMRQALIVAVAVQQPARPVMTVRKTVMRQALIVAVAVQQPARPVMIVRKTVMRQALIVAVNMPTLPDL